MKNRKLCKNRVQTFNGKIQRWVKRDTRSGKILDTKSDNEPYKNIRKIG